MYVTWLCSCGHTGRVSELNQAGRLQCFSRRSFSALTHRVINRAPPIKVAWNEVKNASFAQRSAHRDSGYDDQN